MQFKALPALLVFVGSYFPLALILALQDITKSTWKSGICTSLDYCHLPEFEHPWISLSFVGVAGLCLILTFLILGSLRYKYSVTVVESKSIPSEIIGYTFPYIVSFIGADYGSTGKVAGLAVFLMWLFLITFKAGQIIMNPILLVFGWNLYEARVLVNGESRTVRILARSNLLPKEYRCGDIQGSFITRGDS